MNNYPDIFINAVRKKLLLLLIAAGLMNSAKAGSPAVFAGQIKLTLFGNGTSDHAIIGFNAGATAGYDVSFDAMKTPATNSMNPYIAVVNNNNDFYTNYYTSGQASYTIPLRVKQGVAGKCVLIRDSSLNLPAQTCMFLEDLSTGMFEDFIAGSSYSFTISDTTTAPLFVLHIMSAVDYTVAQPACSYSTNGSIFVKAPATGLWNLNLMDAIGNSMLIHNNINGTDSILNLAPGVYPIELSGNISFCPFLQDTITITVPQVLQVNSVTGWATCRSSNNGFINTTQVSGGKAPYTYNWSNAQNTAIISGLYPGVYTLILSDANGCKDTGYYAVKSMSELKADFSTDKDTLVLQNATLNTINNSIHYTNLQWNFGDGSALSNHINPSHTFTAAGAYTVELTAVDNLCSEKKQKVIMVTNYSSVEELNTKEEITIQYHHNSAYIKFDLSKPTQAFITVYDLTGRTISTREVWVGSGPEEMKWEGQESLYIIEVKTSKIRKIEKVMALQQ